MLGTFMNELDRISPRFDIQGSQIRILQSPSEFYETLKVGHEASLIHREKLMGLGQDIKCGETNIFVNLVHRENRA
jgi:hypothetical protein